jgi:hypothetical protein
MFVKCPVLSSSYISYGPNLTTMYAQAEYFVGCNIWGNYHPKSGIGPLYFGNPSLLFFYYFFNVDPNPIFIVFSSSWVLLLA